MSAPDVATSAGVRELPDEAPALVVAELGRVALERRPVGKPGSGQVLIHTEYSGVSIGTELQMATGTLPGWDPPIPFVAGYQAVGRIVALGDQSSASELAVGDTVACFARGTHQRYIVAEAAVTHRVTPNERLHTLAVFVQPTVGAIALNKTGLRTGDSILVIGQGLVGQATAQLARLRGAYVIGSDVSSERLALSAAHSVDRAIDAATVPVSEQIVDQFPSGVDVVIDTTGLADQFEEAMKCLRYEGLFVPAANYLGLPFPTDPPYEKQLRAVFPSWPDTRECREGTLRLLTRGVLDLQPLITDFVGWQESANTYNRLFTPERNRLNGVIFDWRDAR